MTTMNAGPSRDDKVFAVDVIRRMKAGEQVPREEKLRALSVKRSLQAVKQAAPAQAQADNLSNYERSQAYIRANPTNTPGMGTITPLPDGPLPGRSVMDMADDEFQQRYPTPGGPVGEFARGIVNAPANTARAVAGLVGDPLARAGIASGILPAEVGTAIDRNKQAADTQFNARGVSGAVGSGIGQVLTGGVIARGAGLAAGAGTLAAQGAEAGYRDYRESVGPQEASTLKALAVGGGYGLAEYAAERFGLGAVLRAGDAQGFKNGLKAILQASGVNASEEFVTQVAQNAIAKTYDPNRPVLQGAGMAAGVGAIAGGFGAAAMRGAGRAASPTGVQVPPPVRLGEPATESVRPSPPETRVDAGTPNPPPDPLPPEVQSVGEPLPAPVPQTESVPSSTPSRPDLGSSRLNIPDEVVTRPAPADQPQASDDSAGSRPDQVPPAELAARRAEVPAGESPQGSTLSGETPAGRPARTVPEGQETQPSIRSQESRGDIPSPNPTPESGRVEFTTEKGSTYVHKDGRTTRNKAARPEHPGEVGPQPESTRTVYLTDEQQQALSLVQSQGGKGRTHIVTDPKTGAVAVAYLDGPDAGKIIRGTVVANPATEPSMGLYPLEIWERPGKRNNEHFGNKITEVQSGRVGPPPAEVANPPVKAKDDISGPVVVKRQGKYVIMRRTPDGTQRFWTRGRARNPDGTSTLDEGGAWTDLDTSDKYATAEDALREVRETVKRDATPKVADESVNPDAASRLSEPPKADAGTQPPQGRPDLANPAREQSARDFVDAVDEKRNQAGEPVRRSDKDVLAEAESRLKKDYSGERKRLIDNANKGVLPSDTDVMIARRIVEDSALKAITGGDSEAYYEALTIANAYRNQGTDIARSFRQRRESATVPVRRPLPSPKRGESRAEAVLRSFEDRARKRMEERRSQFARLRSQAKPGQRIGGTTAIADTIDAVAIGVSRAVRAGIRGGRSSIQAIRDIARDTAKEIEYEGDVEDLAGKIQGVIDRSIGTDGDVSPEKLDRALAALESPETDAAAMNRDAIAAILTTPAPRVRRRLGRIQDQIREARDAGDAERVKKLENAKEKTLRRAADTVKDVQAKMKALGVDPESITNADLSDPDTAARLARAVSTAQSTGWDMVHEFWINSILSGPLTHVRNITGNTAFGAWELGLGKLVDAAIGKIPGFSGSDAPTFTEWAETWKAFMPSLAEATRSFAGAFRTEMPIFTDSVRGYADPDGTTGVKGEVANGRAAIPGRTGRIVRIPTRILQATDEFYKTIYTKMVLHGEAYRLARKDGLDGFAARKRAAELVQNPTPELWEAGLKEAERLTFQTDTDISKSLNRIKVALPGLRYIVPFVKTPLNVFGAGLKMSPLGVFGTAARIARKGLVQMEWVPDSGWTYTRRDLGRDIATNILSIGAAGMLFGLLDDDEPLITGSAAREYGKRAAQQRTAPPYSVRIGDSWYSYRGVEPFATALATTVDGLNSYRKADTPSKQVAALGSAVSGLVKQSSDKTFLKGLGDIFAAIENQSGTGKEAAGMLTDMAVGFVPNIIRQPVRAFDATERDSGVRVSDQETYASAAGRNALRKAFASWSLPPRLDIWGRTIENRPTGNVATDVLYRMLSPVQKMPADNGLAVDRMLTNWNNRVESEASGVDLPWWPTAPDNIVNVDGVKYRLTEDEYVRLIKESGSTTIQMLGKLTEKQVSSPEKYDIDMVKRFLTANRKNAARQIIADRNKAPKP